MLHEMVRHIYVVFAKLEYSGVFQVNFDGGVMILGLL